MPTVEQLKDIAQKVKKISEIDFLIKEYSTKDTKLKICFLWEGAYRLNFWGQKIVDSKKGTEECIVSSIFVQIKRSGHTFTVIKEQRD